MIRNNINRDLKEVEDLFYRTEVILSRSEFSEVQEKFYKSLFPDDSNNYNYFTEEQISFLIDKFFENYKYVNDGSINKMYKLINKCFPELMGKFVTEYLKHGNILKLDIDFDEEVISRSLDDCLNETRIINLLSIKTMCEDDVRIIAKIKEKFQENEKESIIQLLEDINAYFCWKSQFKERISEDDDKKLQAIYEFIYLVIKDICRNEEKNVYDIELLGKGAWSIVLGIGNKVIKIGFDRETVSFPNNPYIVPILLRKKFIVNDDISLFVEVTERCKNNVYFSDEERETLLTKLKNIGIKFDDELDSNFGRVSNPNGNVISWRENIYITGEGLGLAPYRGDEVLKQGDLVILDNDYLYDNREDKKAYINGKSR